MSKILKENESFYKRHALKLSPEFTQGSFTWITSLALTVVFLLSSIDFSEMAIKPVVFGVFTVYALFTLIQIIITLKIKQDLKKLGLIRQSTRMLGYIQLFSIFTGNIFVTAFAFQLIKK